MADLVTAHQVFDLSVGGAKIRRRQRRRRAFGRRAARAAPNLCRQVRRRYLVSSDIIDHLLFRVLIKRSDGGEGMSSAVIIMREVVLLEYLLWMLRNVGVHPELTPDDLVDFFTFDLATAPTLS
uniref:Uncharacterized protein n=1 Tax=Ananas comosus var. bracteatus TaxID=296719 RepID=A0A6V7NVP0_ANACO|nr:unnamed protein product [Ananas comosus var. bracteatus]